jgi:hypothetical protein
MWHSNLGKKNFYFSTNSPLALIHLSHRFTTASKSFDFCLSHFRTSVSNSSSPAKCLPSTCEQLYATNTSHRTLYTFLDEYPLHWVLWPPKETQNRTLLFGSTLKHGRHSDYWNQLLNMRMCVCYLDFHEAWLCCYLVIHIENLLRPLQLFYFHLWPIYWLSLLYKKQECITRTLKLCHCAEGYGPNSTRSWASSVHCIFIQLIFPR